MGESRENVKVSGRLIMRQSTDGESVGMRLCEIIWVVAKYDRNYRQGGMYLSLDLK